MNYIACTHIAAADEITEIEPLNITGHDNAYLVRVILIDRHIYWMTAEAKELARVLFPNEGREAMNQFPRYYNDGNDTRDFACPTCHLPNRLTLANKSQGHQCYGCDDRIEAGLQVRCLHTGPCPICP